MIYSTLSKGGISRFTLYLLLLSAVVMAGCDRHRTSAIDPLFPWPSCGLAEVDSLTARLDRNTAFGEPYKDYVALLDSFRNLALKHPENKMASSRYLYFLSWDLNSGGEESRWQHIYDSIMPTIDSVKYAYDIYKWRQFYAHAVHDKFTSYHLSTSNYEYFDKIGDDYEKCRSLILIGNMHKVVNDTANANSYYTRALEIAERGHLHNAAWAIKINLSASMDSARCDSLLQSLAAERMVERAPLRKALTLRALYLNSHNPASLDEAIAEQTDFDGPGILPSLYHLKGEWWLANGNTDSATHYYKLSYSALDRGYDEPDTTLIQFRRAEAYEYEGKMDSAYSEMQTAFHSLNNTIVNLRLADVSVSEIKSHLQSLAHKKELEKTRIVGVMAVCGMLLLSMAAMVALYYRKRMRERKLKADLYEEKLRHSREVNELKGLVMHEKDTFITEISDVIEEAKRDNLNNDPTINRLSKALQVHRSAETDRNTVLSMKEELEPGIENALRRDFPGLTTGQKRMAMMIISGADNRQIGRVMNISQESVWKSRYRLRSRLGLDKDDDLDDFLRKYADSLHS